MISLSVRDFNLFFGRKKINVKVTDFPKQGDLSHRWTTGEQFPAWTNSKNEPLLTVMGLNSAVPFKYCHIQGEDNA